MKILPYDRAKAILSTCTREQYKRSPEYTWKRDNRHIAYGKFGVYSEDCEIYFPDLDASVIGVEARRLRTIGKEEVNEVSI